MSRKSSASTSSELTTTVRVVARATPSGVGRDILETELGGTDGDQPLGRPLEDPLRGVAPGGGHSEGTHRTLGGGVHLVSAGGQRLEQCLLRFWFPVHQMYALQLR